MRLFLTMLFFSAAAAIADSPAMPFPYVSTSEDGRYFISVVPPLTKEPDWHIILRKPYAVLFEPQVDGSFKEKWRINDFYSFRVFLTYDAKFMISIGPWNTGDKPSKEDMAVSFYKDGKFIRDFSTADLIDDPKGVSVSVSHYEWQDYSDSRYPRVNGYLFEIKTIEGKIISFAMDEESNEITMNKNP